MKRKGVVIAATAAILLLLCLWAFSGDSTGLPTGVELLKNPHMSLENEQNVPEDWYVDAYIYTPGYSDYYVKDGAATIVNHALNDARFAQRVSVEPDSLYCLSGYILADATQGLGANLSIEGVYVFSDSCYDTNGAWQEVKLYGKTNDTQTSVTVFARLGGYSGEAIGTASFKNLSLVKVDSVPADYTVHNWYQAPAVYDVQEDAHGQSAWPWLLVIAAAYVALCFLMIRFAMGEERAQKLQENGIHPLLKAVFMLLIAFSARLVIGYMVPGYGVDVGCFTAWANMMADRGAANFYVDGGFCDYPPGYILVLGIIGWFGNLIGTGATEMMIKLPSIICDVLAAAVIYAYARKKIGERGAFALALLYAFNPLTFISGAAWGQADSVMSLCILMVVLLAIENRWAVALPVYMTAVLLKPQALMFGPLGLTALIMQLVKDHSKKQIRDTLLGLLGAVIIAAAVIIPFSVHQESPFWIIELYAGTMGYYDSATVNACNLYFLFGKNWLNVEHDVQWYIRFAAMALLLVGSIVAFIRCGRIGKNIKQKENRRDLIALAVLIVAAVILTCVPMQYDAFGTCVIIFSVVLCALLYLSGDDVRHLPLTGALLLLMLCNFGVMMHERYLFAAVLLLAVSCILERDKRVYWLFAFVTATVFFNVGFVLDRGIRIGGTEGHLHAPIYGIESDSAALEYAVSFCNCLLTAYAAYVSTMLCCVKQTVRYAAAPQNETREEPLYNRAKHSLENAAPLPGMKKIDWLLMLGITAAYAVAAFVNLGSTVSPQTWWQSKTADETVVLDVGKVRTMNMLYYGGIHRVDSDFYVQVSEDGIVWDEGYWASMAEGDCFKWQYLREVYEYSGGTSYSKTPVEINARYVMITARNIATTLYEVILRDPETQQIIPSTVIEGNGEALIDEQHTFSGEPSWYNSTYFDEIYHARTGYEHYLAIQGDYTYHPYETSHPPLGKLLIAFAISVFGMTPFGWRFAGALAGVLMLPGMYLLGKWLTKRRIGAFMAMFLMAVDLMHFTQTRIATIDSFVVLFIIWSYAFMVYYIRMDYWHTPLWKTLVPLALSGLFMGLSVASKWTGCYAGVGLAVLFFWSVWRRFDEYRYACRMLEPYSVRVSKKERKKMQPLENEAFFRNIEQVGLKRPAITLLSCLVFFVAVPLVIYYVSYIPYFLPSGGISVDRVIQAAVGNYFTDGVVGGMLGYHGTPGLGMDHPFYSPWYEWPVIGKPMWYDSSEYLPDGYTQTIAAMGNPLVWWSGLAAMILLILLWCKRHVSRNGIIMHNQTGDMSPAVLLIGFAAQYLPWVLVPRGTYIYHYFTAVPFIILAIALCFDYLLNGCEKTKLRRASLLVTAIFCIAALGMFIAFYPYASGAMTNMNWLRAMQWFDGWIYY